MSHKMNIARIKAVHNALGTLRQEFVFVGGATVSLYADREAEEARATDDVDVVVEIGSYKKFAELEEYLRQIGFKNDSTAKFIGRYSLQGLTVDVMPTDPTILGFSNNWYLEGFISAIDYTIDERTIVKIFSRRTLSLPNWKRSIIVVVETAE